MGGLPKGWAWATLQDVAAWGSGGTPKAKVTDYYDGDIPWAVIGDMVDGVVAKTARCITEDGLASSSAKWIPSGSVLVAMYGTGSIGKVARTAVPLTSNQAIAHAVPFPEVLDPGFLFWYLRSQRGLLEAAGKGGAQLNISQSVLKQWPIPLPPLAEQHRIVESLEEQLSRLDAAERTLLLSRKRVEVLRKSVFTSLVPKHVPADWTVTTVGEAGTVELGRARHPDWHNGPEMRPYLRVANVFEDRIDTSSVMEMDFSGIFDKYKLREGDILLNEGQSPHLVGRPAMYRGVPETVAFTNSLLRFQAGPEVLPEWALMVFRRHLHARRFMREVRITTNIAHLSSKRLKAVEFPIPPLEVQKELIQRCDELSSGVEAMGREIDRATRRADALRSALLRKAFNGTLAPQDSSDELAATLLARIAVERDDAKPARQAAKRAARPHKVTAAAAAAKAAPAPTPAPSTSVQQELFDQ
ncbi:restriction endonuclease subunit S [Streptomyces sp. NPDC090083]|uniref:restriction endonuclease subunit S n=1 Tax=Streptomyces sp. NPDC090083 TaxID=3365941 RepID=UPI00381857AC